MKLFNQFSVLREEDLSKPADDAIGASASTVAKIARKRMATEDDMEEVEEEESNEEGAVSEKKKLKFYRTSNDHLTPQEPGSSEVNKDRTPSVPESQQLQSTEKPFKIKKFVCPTEMSKEEQIIFINSIPHSNKNLNARLIFRINGQPIIQAFDEETASKLQEDISFKDRSVRLVLLEPEMKVTKLILLRYRAERPLFPIEEMESVVSAERVTKFTDKIPQDQVIIKWKGPFPKALEVPFHRKFPLVVYQEPPLQCKKCYRYNHKIYNCRFMMRCGICAQQHETQLCLDKRKKDNKETRMTCPNCKGNHPAWSWGCPERPESNLERQRRLKNEKMAQEDKKFIPASIPNSSAWSKSQTPQPPPRMTPKEFPLLNSSTQGDSTLSQTTWRNSQVNENPYELIMERHSPVPDPPYPPIPDNTGSTEDRETLKEIVKERFTEILEEQKKEREEEQAV